MIIFKTVGWKNFLSTGNYFTDIEFENDLTLITGANGSGKTTMLDALVFALFGVPYRNIKKSQLVNSSNKKGLVTYVEFDIGEKNYYIERGISPNYLKIVINGIEKDSMANLRDAQKWLEDNVLKMNVKTFRQIVILGSTNFIPFMKLTAPQRREVVEDILDIGVFSRMLEQVKIEIADLKAKLTELNFEKQNLQNLQQVNRANIEERILELQSEMDANDNELEKAKKQKLDLLEKIVDAESIYIAANELRNKHAKAKVLKSQVNKEISLYNDRNECPTCKQTIPEEWKRKRRAELFEKNAKLEILFEKLEKSLSEKTKKLEEIQRVREDISRLDTRIMMLKEAISHAEKQISQLKEQKENLQENANDVVDVDNRIEEVRHRLSICKKAISYLRDDGIKKKIIEKYIPVINDCVNKYLEDMGFTIQFHLDGEFKETIKSLSRENFSYESFSEGEKIRINLAILFAWRKVAKMKNSVATNLLIMDEILDGSADQDAIYTFFDLIKKIIEEERLKIIIISHTQGQYESKFDRVLNFSKKKGFSYVEEVL